MGRGLKELLLILLPCGNIVTILDRLLGSITVGGTIITDSTRGWPLSWSVYVLIICLLSLWDFSPLGSQAVLRVVFFENNYVRSNSTRHYLNTSYWAALPGSGSDGDIGLIVPDIFMNSVLVSPFDTKLAATDLWGNVRIPRLEALGGDPDPQGWLTMPGSLDYLDYSSLIGIPIGQRLLPAADSTYVTTLQSWYWNLDCDPWLNFAGSAFRDALVMEGFTMNATSNLYPISPLSPSTTARPTSLIEPGRHAG